MNTKPKRNILYQTDKFEIVSIEWTQNSLTEVHNHGWSQCHVLIEEGLFKNTLDLGVKLETRIFEKGQLVSSPVGARHHLKCLSESGKTLHVYTPKIQELTEDGKFSSTVETALLKDLQLGSAENFDQLSILMKEIQQQSLSTHSPLFMNQLFAGVFPHSIAAAEVLAQTRTTMATIEASPVFTKIETEIVQKLGELIGWSEDERDGVGVPGGSSANFMALHCARQKHSPDYRKKGFGTEKYKIYVSQEAHYSFQKACIVLGFGEESLVTIETDSQGKMKAQSLLEQVQSDISHGYTPLLACATAGTTVYGAFDPIEEMAHVCKKFNIWLHVDGAWGGPALFSERLKPLLKGVEQADSFTFDAHKLFGSGLTCSFFLTRHPNLLLEANDVSGATYLFHGRDADPGKKSWQCGRGADALSFWMLWKNSGTSGLGQFVDKLLAVRDESIEWIKSQARLKIVSDPEYLNLCVEILPPNGKIDSDWSKSVRQKLIEQNSAMVNFSENSEGSFLRMILAHPYLEFRHIQQILLAALDIK